VSAVPSLAAVVPAYGGRDLLARHLPPLRAELRALRPDAELVVVDDASPEPLEPWLRERFGDVRVRTRATNGGFALAANDAVASVASELVFLMNTDVRVRPGFLGPLVRALAGDVIAATPRVLLDGRDERVESFVTLERADGRVELGQPGLEPGAELPTEPVDVAFPHGGAMLVRRAAFEELGGFDPSYRPFYLEDADFGRRALAAGGRTRYVPAAVVEHHHRGTIGARVEPACVRAAIERNRWMLSRAYGRADGDPAWIEAALGALVAGARRGELRSEATWLALLAPFER